MPIPPFFDASTIGSDWQYIGNRKTITFFIRTSDAVPTSGGLVVPNAFHRTESSFLTDFLQGNTIPFHMWANQIPNGLVNFTATVTDGSVNLTNVVIGQTTPPNGVLIPGQFVTGPGIPLGAWLTTGGDAPVLTVPAFHDGEQVELVAQVIPKAADLIQTKPGKLWIVQSVEYLDFNTRYKMPCLQYVGLNPGV